jgi:hypothetical protein
MQPSQPIKHQKTSLTQEMQMMAQQYPARRPNPNYNRNFGGRPQGFPNHNTFTNPSLIPSNRRQNINPMAQPINMNKRHGSFQSKQPLYINQNNPKSMAGIRSPNNLGASKSFAMNFQGNNNPSINHSNVISVGVWGEE